MKMYFRPRLQGVKLRQRVDSPNEKEHGGRGTGALWGKQILTQTSEMLHMSGLHKEWLSTAD